MKNMKRNTSYEENVALRKSMLSGIKINGKQL